MVDCIKQLETKKHILMLYRTAGQYAVSLQGLDPLKLDLALYADELTAHKFYNAHKVNCDLIEKHLDV